MWDAEKQISLPPFDRLTVRLRSLSLSGVEGRAVSEVERRLRDRNDGKLQADGFEFRRSQGGIKMNPIYIARSNQIAARNLGGEMMIMSAADSTLFSLNDVGTLIWEAADGETPLQEIVERKVCAQFDIDPAEALEDAESFVRELAGHGILLVSETPVGSGRSKVEG